MDLGKIRPLQFLSKKLGINLGHKITLGSIMKYSPIQKTKDLSFLTLYFFESIRDLSEFMMAHGQMNICLCMDTELDVHIMCIHMTQ